MIEDRPHRQSAHACAPSRRDIRALVFDMDGVLLDTEDVWHEVRRDFVAAHGGRWVETDQLAVMGANSAQWSSYIREHFGLAAHEDTIYRSVVDMLKGRYSAHPPLVPGAREAVRGLATVYPLGLASSSPLELIRFALAAADLEGCFRCLVSSDDVALGKPAPDVYLLACRRLGVEPESAAAIEDSSNGILAAAAAGMAVVAIPNASFPPSLEAVRAASRVLSSVAELTAGVIRAL